MPVLHSELAKRARAALKADALTREATIKVLDDNGFVTLEGTAPSDAARQMAEEIVKQQPGVRRVFNKLEVKGVDRSQPSSQPVPPEEHPYIEA
jgi:osmotically-inducible protein OsmY